MLMEARRLLLVLIAIAITNLTIHLINSSNPNLFKDVTRFKKRYNHLSNRSLGFANISLNWKMLYDSIVLNEKRTQDTSLNKTNHLRNLIKKTDLMFRYYFDAGAIADGSVLCPVIPPDLGPIAEDKDIMNLYGIDDMVLRIQPGGIHVPVDCIAQQQVAVIVAVHETHERIRNYIGSFLYYMHPFLMKQQLEYQIFVVLKVEALPPYKRGELFNIGFKAAQSYRNDSWDCIIFHDPHLVPLDTRNLYRCSPRPKRLVADLRMPCKIVLTKLKFGGAMAIKPDHFIKVNGFSNLAWTNDDDYIDMYKRLLAANFTVEANSSPIGNYTSFEYLKQDNEESLQSLTAAPNFFQDGLSNVTFSSKIELRQFYSLIEVLFDT